MLIHVNGGLVPFVNRFCVKLVNKTLLDAITSSVYDGFFSFYFGIVGGIPYACQRSVRGRPIGMCSV